MADSFKLHERHPENFGRQPEIGSSNGQPTSLLLPMQGCIDWVGANWDEDAGEYIRRITTSVDARPGAPR